MSDSGNFKQSLLQIHLPLLGTQLLFSTIPVAAKLAFKSFSPETVVFFRIAGSALLFWILFLLFFKQPVRDKKDLLSFAVFALFGIVGNQYLFVKGVSYTLSINASILITTIPVFTLIFALLLKMEKITLPKFLGVVTALIGAGYLVGVEKLEFTSYLKGNLLILANSASFALYLVISKPMLKKYRPYTVITYMYLFATIMALPLTLGSVLKTPFASIAFANYAPLVVIVIFGTFIPYLINKLILQKTVSSVVAIYTYIQPLVGSILAMLFLNESVTTKIILSGLLILFGVTLVSFHKAFALPNMYQFIRSGRSFNKQ